MSAATRLSGEREQRLLRIGIFYQDFLQPGGFPRETELLARSMAKLTERVVVYCLCSTRSDETLRFLGDVYVRPAYSPRLAWRLNMFSAPASLRQTLESNLDGIDACILISSFLAANVAVARHLRSARVPYFLAPSATLNPALLHGMKGVKKKIFGRMFERKVALQAAGIRFYSADHRRHWEDFGYLRSGQPFIVKEGIDPAQLAQMIVEQGARKEDYRDRPGTTPPVFGFLGRLSIYPKGLDRLLAAWQIYKRQGGSGQLQIRGPGHKKEVARLRELVRRHMLSDVMIAGPLEGPEKYTFVSGLTVLVLASRHEGIPRVVRESFAAGCPVIVTRDTNMHDVVDEFGAGWVTDGDPASLAETMWFAATEPDIEARRRGAFRAADSLSWDSIAAQWLTEIESRIAPTR